MVVREDADRSRTRSRPGRSRQLLRRPPLLRAVMPLKRKNMKKIALSVALSGLICASLAATPASVTGTYVEARTAEVFAGACVVNSEGGTTGREAVLAWKVDRGQVNGVPLDGLAVVAALASDINLGIHEIGGEPAVARAAIFVDARATAAQRKALVS